MANVSDAFVLADLARIDVLTSRGAFVLAPLDTFVTRARASYERELQLDLVRSPPTLPTKPASHSLAAFQTAIRNQMLRGTCFSFAIVAAMEALYLRRFGVTLDLSEHYAFHRLKYGELYGDYVTSAVAWEDNSSFWDGQGSGGCALWMRRFGVPTQADCAYLDKPALEALRVANPAAGLLDGVSTTQEQIDAFELAEGLVPRAARMRARYRIVEALALPYNAAASVIEDTLLANHEVIADIAWNPVWNQTKNAFDYGGGGGGHCVLIVGYDRTARVFLVKNSHNDGQLLRMSYDYFSSQSAWYHYITEVSDPSDGPDETAPWIGSHAAELGGAGTLVVRRTTDFRDTDATAPTKLGEFYQGGQGRDVNGMLIDGGRGAILHVADTTARVKPGSASGPLHRIGEQGSWRWCCKCQSLFFAGNAAPTACARGGAHDSSGSGWYAVPYTFSPLGGQPGWAWCRKCQTLYYARHAGGRCPSDGQRHDPGGSANYVLGWEGSPRTFDGQTRWRWCNKCDALFFAGGGATACPAGSSHDENGSGWYVLRHSLPLGWQKFGGALRSISVGVDGTVVGTAADGTIHRRAGAGWQKLPGLLVQVSVGSAAHIWGVNAAQEIFNWSGQGWTRVDGALTCVAAAADGTVWGVNAAQQIYRRSGAGWQLIGGALRQIAVASASLVFGVASGGEVFRRAGESWERIGTGLRQVSVALDGSVWGTNPGDQILRWNGITWDTVNGGLRQVTHRSRDRVWGVSSLDEIWHVDRV